LHGKKKDEKYNGTNISIFLGKVLLSQQLLHVPDAMKKFMWYLKSKVILWCC